MPANFCFDLAQQPVAAFDREGVARQHLDLRVVGLGGREELDAVSIFAVAGDDGDQHEAQDYESRLGIVQHTAQRPQVGAGQ